MLKSKGLLFGLCNHVAVPCVCVCVAAFRSWQPCSSSVCVCVRVCFDFHGQVQFLNKMLFFVSSNLVAGRVKFFRRSRSSLSNSTRTLVQKPSIPNELPFHLLSRPIKLLNEMLFFLFLSNLIAGRGARWSMGIPALVPRYFVFHGHIQ